MNEYKGGNLIYILSYIVGINSHLQVELSPIEPGDTTWGITIYILSYLVGIDSHLQLKLSSIESGDTTLGIMVMVTLYLMCDPLREVKST